MASGPSLVRSVTSNLAPTAWQKADVTHALHRLHSALNAIDEARLDADPDLAQDLEELIAVSYELLVERAVRVLGRARLRAAGIEPHDLLHELIADGDIRTMIKSVDFTDRRHFLNACHGQLKWAASRIVSRLRRAPTSMESVPVEDQAITESEISALEREFDLAHALASDLPSDRHREVVLLRYGWAQTPPQIAAILNVDRSTVYRDIDDIKEILGSRV